MALYEYRCRSCQHRFEEISRASESQLPACPKCQAQGPEKGPEKLISKFAVAGRGDLRQSTMHGCHAAPDLSDGGAAPDPGHVHGPGCKHG